MHELVLRGDNYVLCKPCIETECGCFVKNKLYPCISINKLHIVIGINCDF